MINIDGFWFEFVLRVERYSFCSLMISQTETVDTTYADESGGSFVFYKGACEGLSLLQNRFCLDNCSSFFHLDGWWCNPNVKNLFPLEKVCNGIEFKSLHSSVIASSYTNVTSLFINSMVLKFLLPILALVLIFKP